MSRREGREWREGREGREGRALDMRVYPPVPPSKCAKVLYYTWKLCSVVFSHFVMISLVVAYCVLGAVTFEKLEAQNEKEVKQNISQIRHNCASSIWDLTYNGPLLYETNWTEKAVLVLKDFENALLLEMKVRGWDGSESPDHIQWTFTGALFYSIIVITTIGYGHITPKTQNGKVVTIFYAILGIPLMLLCLSNIGDVMASSFRFLYWRVCCYVCTRPPKRRRRHHSAASSRRSLRGRTVSTRKRPRPLERAHSDTDCRYRDSGYSSGRPRRPRPPPAPAARAQRTRSQPPAYVTGIQEFDREDRSPAHVGRNHYDTCAEDQEEFPKISLPLRDLAAALKDLDDHQKQPNTAESRSKSLPRPSKTQAEYGARRDWNSNPRHHEVNNDQDGQLLEMHDLYDVDYENFKERKAIEERERKRKEREDYGNYRDRDYEPDDEDYEFDSPRSRRNWDDRRKPRGRYDYCDDREKEERKHGRRARSAVYEYEGGWEQDARVYDRHDRIETEEYSPKFEFSGKPKRLRRLQTIDDSYRNGNRYSPSPDEDWSDEEAQIPKRSKPHVWATRQPDAFPVTSDHGFKEEIKPVPIWLCVLLVASYIVVGTFLFKQWEGWAYLDAAYFCFITLTTIGFGDFVPAQGQGGEPAAAVHSIALCSLYLLFGIALLAMSFNLVQEEVRANVAALAKKLGIIKPDGESESDE